MDIGEEFLKKLVSEVMSIKKRVSFKIIKEEDCSITYFPTKQQAFIGIKSGYAEQILRIEKRVSEREKLNKSCKNYLKVFKNEKGKIVQIENYVNGEFDFLFQTYFVKDSCYFIPYFKDGSFYPTYTYVTEWKEGRVSCEYMVDGNQIIYESYFNETENTADYYFINYIKKGRYPTLNEKKGIVYKHPLKLKITESSNYIN